VIPLWRGGSFVVLLFPILYVKTAHLAAFRETRHNRAAKTSPIGDENRTARAARILVCSLNRGEISQTPESIHAAVSRLSENLLPPERTPSRRGTSRSPLGFKCCGRCSSRSLCPHSAQVLLSLHEDLLARMANGGNQTDMCDVRAVELRELIRAKDYPSELDNEIRELADRIMRHA